MTTNYVSTFIEVAEDCPERAAKVPPSAADKKTVAALQYDLIANNPYRYTSDDVIFEVHALRNGMVDADKPAQREAFFAKSQACLRSSALCRRYGWGIHHDAEARVALIAVGSDRYGELADDASLTHVKAMRSRRA